MNYKIVKEVTDFTLALIVFVAFFCFFLLISLAIILDSKGPVLFKQKRIGLDKSNFLLYKFRTMKIDAPKDTPTHVLINPAFHITKIGKILRKTSLDELPQLWNILMGDISIIGPRPALWNQFDLISERDKYSANSIKPGLTGWAQINGRDELGIVEKAKLDGEYAKKIGPLIDVKCFLGTILKVFLADGIVEGNQTKKS